MVLLEKIWDDVAGGPQPDHGLGRLRKLATPLNIKDIVDIEGSSSNSSKVYQRSLSMPVSPVTPATPVTPSSARTNNNNVWRSVFHPGSNLATKGIGAEVFDKPMHPNSPTVYDCNEIEAQRRQENMAMCFLGAWK
ncbi:hypothetical protein ACFE04_002964 [Oxalis oulophora]